LGEGEDLSLLEFKAIQYRQKGNAVADEEQLARIAKVPRPKGRCIRGFSVNAL
jgi:hypothetical protein